MEWLISQEQVVGVFNPEVLNPDQLPAGFSIADGPEALIESVYYDPTSNTVKLKPEPPGDRYHWDPELREWRELQPVGTSLLPNWDGLLGALRGASLWVKVFTASKVNLDTSTSFTVLYGTLTSDRNMETLEWAIGAMRLSMAGTTIGDFTADEIAQINTMLSTNRFPFQVSDSLPAPAAG